MLFVFKWVCMCVYAFAYCCLYVINAMYIFGKYSKIYRVNYEDIFSINCLKYASKMSLWIYITGKQCLFLYAKGFRKNESSEIRCKYDTAMLDFTVIFLYILYWELWSMCSEDVLFMCLILLFIFLYSITLTVYHDLTIHKRHFWYSCKGGWARQSKIIFILNYKAVVWRICIV